MKKIIRHIIYTSIFVFSLNIMTIGSTVAGKYFPEITVWSYGHDNYNRWGYNRHGIHRDGYYHGYYDTRLSHAIRRGHRNRGHRRVNKRVH